MPCGATMASKCEPCAQANRRLRMQQIREGWHLTDEPVTTPEPVTVDQEELVGYRADLEFARQAAVLASNWPAVDALDAEIAGRMRIWRRPVCGVRCCPVAARTAPTDRSRPRPGNGRRSGVRTRRTCLGCPSLTAPSRTRISARMGGNTGTRCSSPSPWARTGRCTRPTGGVGGSRSASAGSCTASTIRVSVRRWIRTSYDYRRAALDSIHFARVLDRFWQNLRRAVGWKVQYAGSVEHQKRLAPHAHFAVRGALPRRLVKQVAAATYHQVWWPAHDQLVYDPDGELPVWDADTLIVPGPVDGGGAAHLG